MPGSPHRRVPEDPEGVRTLVAGHLAWYHQIELAPGIVTPGTHRSSEALAILDRLGLPREASGRRVLDVGSRDGFFAFEMERRGAEVVAIDYAAPDVTGFSIAASALGSSVRYVVDNVYNLDPARHGRFDLILFLGVLYHLRNPLLALDRVRAMASPEALVFVETQLATDSGVRDLPLPAWQFLPRDSLCGDGTNKWAPNLAGLRAVLEECQLGVRECIAGPERACLRAQPVEDRQLEFFRGLDGSVGAWGRR
jgi:tRNA (mo5U34)-methyltransferase